MTKSVELHLDNLHLQYQSKRICTVTHHLENYLERKWTANQGEEMSLTFIFTEKPDLCFFDSFGLPVFLLFAGMQENKIITNYITDHLQIWRL